MSETLIAKPSRRLASIDAYRALNMLFMIFVNDLESVKGLPYWIDHAKDFEDRMGFADCIFPAFLFIVGLSIPHALNRKINSGESVLSISFGIIVRSFALLLMGFFHVNLESYSRFALLPEGVWEILITLAFFLIWIDYSENISRLKQNIFRGAGVLIVVIMAVLYKGGESGSNVTHWMRPEWWGILGIIGWAYLVSAFIYFLVNGKLSGLLFAFLVFTGLNIAVHAWHFRINIIGIADGSAIAQVLGGIIISIWYSRLIAKGFNNSLWVWLLIAGAASIVSGFILRPYTDGISKIHSTPAWVMICTGISIFVFTTIAYLVDFKGKKKWFNWIWPAGTATLTCYLIPYFQVGFYKLFHYVYPHFLNFGWDGFIRSWVTAFAVVLIGGYLERWHLKLKI